MHRTEIERKVTQIVGEALDTDVSKIQLYSSLIDDLGAESIDFLDIRFRIESSFQIKIKSDDEIWEGRLLRENAEFVTEQGVNQEGLERLKEVVPDFRWDRFPNGITRRDFPRLITVGTIVEYLHHHFQSPQSGQG